MRIDFFELSRKIGLCLDAVILTAHASALERPDFQLGIAGHVLQHEDSKRTFHTKPRTGKIVEHASTPSSRINARTE
jgi:pyridoxine/pyridoxamine 5'-phosphate oxidase